MNTSKTPTQETGYLYDGRTLRLNWGNQQVLNLHLSGSLLRRIESTQGISEHDIIHSLGKYINRLIQGAS